MKEIDFDAEIPFVVDGVEQLCYGCKAPILVGDYIQLLDNDDCTEEGYFCLECLNKKGYAIGPRLTLVWSADEDPVPVCPAPNETPEGELQPSNYNSAPPDDVA